MRSILPNDDLWFWTQIDAAHNMEEQLPKSRPWENMVGYGSNSGIVATLDAWDKIVDIAGI